MTFKRPFSTYVGRCESDCYSSSQYFLCLRVVVLKVRSPKEEQQPRQLVIYTPPPQIY
jgi:hypothetical protein